MKPRKHNKSRNNPEHSPDQHQKPGDFTCPNARETDKEVSTSRRQVLKLFTVAGLSSVFSEACSSPLPDYHEQFTQNFDPHAYSRLGEQDLEIAQSRNQKIMGAVDCRFAFQTAIDLRLDHDLDINDVFQFFDEEGQVKVDNHLGATAGQQALMEKYPTVTKIIDTINPDPTVYHQAYALTIGNKVLRLALGDFAVAFKTSKDPAYVELVFDTSTPAINETDENRLYQRKIVFNGEEPKTIFFEVEEGKLESETQSAQSFSNNNSKNAEIINTNTFIEFLRKAKGTPTIDSFLRQVNRQNLLRSGEFGRIPEVEESFFGLTDVQNTDQLIEIFKLLPADPKVIGSLMTISLRAHYLDSNGGDEYRHPVTTLQSGWADCDDYAVINAFWVYLHGFQPYMTVVTNDKTGIGHVFVWYRDTANQLVIMDNAFVGIYSAEQSVEDYIDFCLADEAKWNQGDPYTINFNGII